MQEGGDISLLRFRSQLNDAIDDELIKVISNTRDQVHISNVDRLLNVCSDTVTNVLQSSPPELKNTLKLFLNRLI